MTGTAEAERAAKQLERTYCTKRRRTRYIACEDYDFTWSEIELEAFRKMWKEGTPLNRIAIALRRHINEVAILAIDQAEKGHICEREGAAYGSAWKEMYA